METENNIPSTLKPAERCRIVGAIASVVRQTFQHPMPLGMPQYPDAIPEIERHIDQLVRVVRESKEEVRAVQIVKHSCPACPHQYPTRYCPLRARGGCALYQCAGPIGQTIALVLDKLDRERSEAR